MGEAVASPRSLAKQLFARAVDFLEQKDGLAAAICSGIDGRRWCALTRALCREAGRVTGLDILVDYPGRGSRQIARSKMFALIERSIDAGQPVLIELRGAYDHFSIVTGYTARSLLLHDSFGYRWINREVCGLQPEFRHTLVANSLTVLKLADRPA